MGQERRRPTHSNSASVSSNAAAPRFSSRCAMEDVPGIGSITGERRSSHASETTGVDTPRAAAIFSITSLAFGSGQAGSRVETQSSLLRNNRPRNPILCPKTVAVLDRDNRNDFARTLDVLERNVRETDMPNFPLLLQAGERSIDASKETAGSGIWSWYKSMRSRRNRFRLPATASSRWLGTRIMHPLRRADARPAAFGGNHQALRIGMEGFGDQFL